MKIKSYVILLLFFQILSLPLRGQIRSLRVFTTGYQGSGIPIQHIVLKEFGMHKTFYNQWETG